MPGTASDVRQRPGSPTELFVAFSLLALQGFGGVLAVVQRELVERRKWLTPEEFIEDWAVAQILPGPNVVNLSLMIGSRHFGLRGAIAAMLGMLVAPLTVLMLITLIYASVADLPAAQGALRGMGAVAAGLIGATGIKLVSALKGNPMGHPACALLGLATFVLIALLRVPLVLVLPGIGVAGCVLAYRRLTPDKPRTEPGE